MFITGPSVAIWRWVSCKMLVRPTSRASTHADAAGAVSILATSIQVATICSHISWCLRAAVKLTCRWMQDCAPSVSQCQVVRCSSEQAEGVNVKCGGILSLSLALSHSLTLLLSHSLTLSLSPFLIILIIALIIVFFFTVCLYSDHLSLSICFSSSCSLVLSLSVLLSPPADQQCNTKPTYDKLSACGMPLLNSKEGFCATDDQ